jgi:hypothetical protein
MHATLLQDVDGHNTGQIAGHVLAHVLPAERN